MASMVEGTVNFRTPAGLPLAGGGEVADGVLYRSDALHAVTERGAEQLAGLGLAMVVDLRAAIEREQAPDRLPGGDRAPRLLELSILEGRQGKALDADDLASMPTLPTLYRGMLRNNPEDFACIMRALGGAEGGVLLHCTAGKNRTGVATALVLEVAGVRRESVIDDYAATRDHLAGAWADAMMQRLETTGVQLTPELIDLVTASPAPVMRELLEWLDDQGGVLGYLSAAGVTPTELTAVRDRVRGAHAM